ncbi:MAG: PRC-barrel domain-containing protein, partial [Coriobacteriia bacterium]|nr:PRC-barrel domain-containing protein [Coriobacteriia bacterium]
MHLSDLEELQVFDARGKAVGRVARVLFHPSDPVLVGFEVRMKLFLYLFERKRRYVPRSGVKVTSRAVTLAEGARLEKVGGRQAGVDWSAVVVWRGMPVRTASGTPVGLVKDADLDGDGRVTRLVLTRGATSDMAIGVREVPADA